MEYLLIMDKNCIFGILRRSSLLIPVILSVALISSGAGADPFYSPNQGKYPLNVQFTLPGGAACDSVFWDFGDDSNRSQINPLYTYKEMGIFYPLCVCTLPGATVSYEFGKIVSRNANFPEADTYDNHYPYNTVVDMKTDTLSTDELKKQGDGLVALGLDQYAAESYKQLVAMTAASDPGILAEYGRILVRLSRWNEAGDAFEQAIKIKPDSDLLNAYGRVLLKINRYEAARDVFNQSLGLKDSDARAWAGFADALAALNRTEEAEGAYDKSVRLDAGQAAVWIGFGDILSVLGKNPEAVTAYEKAIALGMSGAENYNKYSQLLRKVGRDQDALNARNIARSS